ncbi:DNA mismatch repair proteinC-terminal [Penicillium daleae]|uniref:DNA mismatch repair proteinC-terminal n=1 Tax=Penicillium daleae TaxID=63821 RepID=A0AAD6CBQ2_9EURO|nr:DNA mismatch repair proteinC-terminal [Penicillium daleae]KAJ5455600.1 DNA mismatch repair proteinC-terminal [Penicillium daleae]
MLLPVVPPKNPRPQSTRPMMVAWTHQGIKLRPFCQELTQVRFLGLIGDVRGLMIADLSKANNKGQFPSIDGRPVSTSRGIGHDIVKLFKSYVRAANSKSKGPKSVSDPFLCLQLKCPLGSYDVNIEPGKDDVIFEDRELVFGLIENVFADHYGALPDAATKNSARKTASSNHPEGNASFDLLMARRPAKTSQIMSSDELPVTDVPLITSCASQRPSHSPAVECPEQTPINGSRTKELEANSVSEGRTSRHINPWSISRINASFPAPDSGPQNSLTTTRQAPMQRHTPQRPTFSSSPQISEIPSPVLSRLTPVSPLNRRQHPPTSHESPLQPPPSISASRRAARERDKERYGNGALDTWFQWTTQASLGQSSMEVPIEPEEAVPTLSQLAEQRFNPVPDAPTITPFSALPPREQTPELPSRQINVLVSPDRDHHARQIDSGRGFPVLENWAASIHEGFTPESSSELEKALDFERRKREANQRHRTQSGRSNPGTRAPTSKSPHHNRHLAAKAAWTADSTEMESPSANAPSQGDPRAYLISLQLDQRSNKSSDDSGTVRRTRTSRLPLERIPEGLDLHNLQLPVKTSSSDILKLFNMTVHHDSYIQCGDESESLLLSDVTELIPSWNERLSMIISKSYKTNEHSQNSGLCIDISTVIADLSRQFRSAESQSA